MSTKHLGVEHSSYTLPTGEVLQKVFSLGGNSVTHHEAALSGATDPLAGKAAGSRFAESAVIRVIADNDIHIAFGATAPTADTSDPFLAGNVEYYFLINSRTAFISIIDTAADTPDVWITELF